MLSTFSGLFDDGFSTKYKFLFLSLALTLIAASGCANITLKPKDPELIAFESFANKVTAHIFEVNPDTYNEYQKLLSREIAPNVLSQLNKAGIYASSKDQIQQNIKAMNLQHKRYLIRIDSTNFPSKATAQGLIPIEVQGTCVKTLNDTSKASRFDVLYLVGTSKETKEPMVASIEIKRFD
jgi:hypothetical protein